MIAKQHEDKFIICYKKDAQSWMIFYQVLFIEKNLLAPRWFIFLTFVMCE